MKSKIQEGVSSPEKVNDAILVDEGAKRSFGGRPSKRNWPVHN